MKIFPAACRFYRRAVTFFVKSVDFFADWLYINSYDFVYILMCGLHRILLREGLHN